MLRAVVQRLRHLARRRAAVVDVDDLAARIAVATRIELQTVARVLDLEAELQEGVGLAHPPRAALLYYDAADFVGLAAADGADVARIAGDAERLLGIPRAVAGAVLDAETRQLQALGVADAG